MNIENLKSKSISAVFFDFFGSVARNVIQFLITIILARILSPRDYGLLGMTMIFTAISQVFIDGGMISALIREKEVDNIDYSTVFYYNFLVAGLFYLVLFSSASQIARFFNEPLLKTVLRVVSLNLIIGSFGLIQKVQLMKELNFKDLAKIHVIASVTSGLFAIFLAYNGYGIWSLVSNMLLSQIIISFLLILTNKWFPLWLFSKKSFERLFGFGWKMLLAGLFATLYHNVYNIVIGKTYPSNILGYYTKSYSLVTLASTTLLVPVGNVSYPALSNLQDKPELYKTIVRKVLKNANFIFFPIMVLLAVIASPLIRIIFGEKWLPMIPYFQVLCLASTTFACRAINLNILQVAGRSDLFLKLDLFAILIGLLSVGTCLFFKTGIYGLLTANFITSHACFFIYTFYSKKTAGYSTKEQLRDMIPVALVSILTGAIVYIIGTTARISSPVFVIFFQMTSFLTGFIVFCKIFRIKELATCTHIIKVMLARFFTPNELERRS